MKCTNGRRVVGKTTICPHLYKKVIYNYKLTLIKQRLFRKMWWFESDSKFTENVHVLSTSVGVCVDKNNQSIVLCLQNKPKVCSGKHILQWIILATFIVSYTVGVGMKPEVLSNTPVCCMLCIFFKNVKLTILKFECFVG